MEVAFLAHYCASKITEKFRAWYLIFSIKQTIVVFILHCDREVGLTDNGMTYPN